MTFIRESDFENALINALSNKGWESEVINCPSEQDLIDNWANILYQNNRHIDKLNDYPLTDGEMQQILEQVNNARTPMRINQLINGGSISIKRDNRDDEAHFGKEVSLKIYNRNEIAAGQSRYQIVRQPRLASISDMPTASRGDLMLLINGMPVFHIELKRSGTPLSNAYRQIEHYSRKGAFTGIFSLVQIFVAMTPDSTRYFANPGTHGHFNPAFYFNWADFNNEPINHWREIAFSLLSIPMAHMLIGFYTVADESDGILKVMRSYQFHAAHRISDKVAKIHWGEDNQKGGYIWHTTGSGKTMTSFKSAQLIANSHDADKVVFLTDRIELGTQSLKVYRAFAEEKESVQATEDTYVLINKLKSADVADMLIVTSIQKMSNIRTEDYGLNAHDMDVINRKRVVFIVDEAHRSTFGEMLLTIKASFPNAIFFGFTGTPIHEENQKKLSTTATVFGEELHRYSIADGIRDKNVLGFDPYKVRTYRDTDIRRMVALEKAKARNLDEVFSDSRKEKIYYQYMDSALVPMAGYLGEDGKYVKGIEDEIPTVQYLDSEHQRMVVEDIADKWEELSRNGKFHAIFATSSIEEAIQYYRLIKENCPDLKATALFDPHISYRDEYYEEYVNVNTLLVFNNDEIGHTDDEELVETSGELSKLDRRIRAMIKQDGLVEIISDYNELYDLNFTLSSHDAFKRDIASRLSHKEQYKMIERNPGQQLDLLIVVNQMLTGFDSKWVNTLYMDKLLEYENVIQAFSRTNRLFGPEKPHGTIRYYRKPHTMERNIAEAVKLYSGDKPLGLFVDKLGPNMLKLNEIFEEISELFIDAGVENFIKLPNEILERAKFALLFNQLSLYLEAAKVQGFTWSEYSYEDEKTGETQTVVPAFDETTYLTLLQRYKELEKETILVDETVPYDLEGYLIEEDTERIDADYMNSKFEKYLKALYEDDASVEIQKEALTELYRTFATLTSEEQKYANIFLHDVQSGDVFVQHGKTLRDYITEYMYQAKDDQTHRLSSIFGLDEEKLRKMMALELNENNINEFGRFEELKRTINKDKARLYFEEKDDTTYPLPITNRKADTLIRDFIFQGGFDLYDEEGSKE